MTKEEFKKVLTMFISGKHDLKYGEIMPGNFDKLLDDVISEAIAEHEKAILDDINFGYTAEMIKGKIENKSYHEGVKP